MPFQPILTDRLLIRPVAASDADALAARRNDPSVAEYQDWTTPYDDAEALIAGSAAMDGPTNNSWWMATVVDRATDAIVGDLVVHLTLEGRCAEVGYTFAAEHWGRGYAVEALQPLVDHLFDDVGVTRVFGMLHPDNLASARVLERTGFLFEGHTRNSFWKDDENSDDWIYGQTPEEHDAWRNRPRHRPVDVELIPVAHSNARDVFELRTHWSQRRFVSPMEHTFTDALFPEVYRGHAMKPWLRAVHADGALVAFVMLGLPTPGQREHYLWRLLVDRLHQRRGIGRRILDLVVAECRRMGAVDLHTSWVAGRGSPESFYLAYGFEPTGDVEDGEIVARFNLE